jgi:hypothetical protein
MPKLTDLLPSQTWLTVPFGSTAIKVAYRPGAVTPRFQKAARAAQGEGNLDASLLEPLCLLIAAWDISDADGALLEITPAGLETVPLPVLFAMLNAITEDMVPNRSRAGVSSNGSSPTAGSAAALTGTSS